MNFSWPVELVELLLAVERDGIAWKYPDGSGLHGCCAACETPGTLHVARTGMDGSFYVRATCLRRVSFVRRSAGSSTRRRHRPGSAGRRQRAAPRWSPETYTYVRGPTSLTQKRPKATERKATRHATVDVPCKHGEHARHSPQARLHVTAASPGSLGLARHCTAWAAGLGSWILSSPTTTAGGAGRWGGAGGQGILSTGHSLQKLEHNTCSPESTYRIPRSTRCVLTHLDPK